MTKDLESMAAVQVASETKHNTELKRLESSLKSKDKDVRSLQDNLHSLNSNIQTLQSSIQTLKSDHSKHAKDLSIKLEGVSGKLQKAMGLLQSSPSTEDQRHILLSLKSSAEVMQLAHASGGVDSMRECLGQVGSVLDDLHGQLQSQHRLSSDWQERVKALVI